jgi:hypothetical protein
MRIEEEIAAEAIPPYGSARILRKSIVRVGYILRLHKLLHLRVPISPKLFLKF